MPKALARFKKLIPRQIRWRLTALVYGRGRCENNTFARFIPRTKSSKCDFISIDSATNFRHVKCFMCDTTVHSNRTKPTFMLLLPQDPSILFGKYNKATIFPVSDKILFLSYHNSAAFC